VIDRADQTAGLAESADATQSVYLVPAFTGLGAPWWDPHARAAMFGMTRSTGPAEFARAALESVCFQTRDLLHAMHERGSDRAQTVLRVDGGMARNDWAMQRLADILDLAADRAASAEISALGAAWLAGNAAGIWPDQLAFSKDLPSGKRFEPNMEQLARDRLCQGWAAAVRSTLDFTAALR
jgi:glycerol kinase